MIFDRIYQAGCAVLATMVLVLSLYAWGQHREAAEQRQEAENARTSLVSARAATKAALDERKAADERNRKANAAFVATIEEGREQQASEIRARYERALAGRVQYPAAAQGPAGPGDSPRVPEPAVPAALHDAYPAERRLLEALRGCEEGMVDWRALQDYWRGLKR